MALRGKLQGLEWLIDEVEATLHQSYEALETYLDDPSDETQIRFCLSHIHQVHGSLKIAECHGPILLSEEMEALAESMLDGRVQNLTDACDVMVQAILKLPAYLRQVMSNRRDQPETLLLLLNELRAVRGEPLVSETSFFTPQMQAAQKLSKPYNRQPDAVSMANLLRKLRQMYQYALLGVVKGEKIEENFGYLDKVFSRLKELSKGFPREPLWTAVLALLEGISAKQIPLGYAVKMLLKELDGQIRQLAAAGLEGMSEPLPETLLKNILFYIAYAHSEAPRAVQVREDYCLNESLPEALLQDGEDGLSPVFHPDTAQAVVAALDEEFAQVKEALDRYTIEGGDNEQLLDDAASGMKRISDSLAVLGRNELRESLENARKQVLTYRDNPSAAVSGCLLLVATQLVEGEAGLHGWLSNNRQLVGESSLSGEMLVEVNSAQASLLEEAGKGLSSVKEAIVEFIASQWQREQLDGVPELLLDIRGALAMVGLDRGAAILDVCRKFLLAEVLGRDSVPNWDSLDALADAITSIECYLECIGQQDEQAEQTILGLAEQGIAKLAFSDAEEPSSESMAVENQEVVDPQEALTSTEQPTEIELPAEEDDFADQEIVDIFIEEVAEVLESIEVAYLQWVDSPSAQEPLADIRRGFHTLKGSSRMLGAETLGELAWAVENLLNKVIEKRVTITPTLIAFVDLAREVIPGLAEAFHSKNIYNREAYVGQLVVAADALAKGEETELPEGSDLEPASSPQTVVEEPVLDANFEPEPEPEPESGEDQEAFIDPELLAIFAAETEEYLTVVQDFVDAQRREAPVYSPPSSTLQRALHTLKGSARMAGINVIGDLVVPLEQYVLGLYTHQLNVDNDIVALLSDVVECCRASIASVHTESRIADIPELEQFLTRLESLKEQSFGALNASEQAPSSVDPDGLNQLMMQGIHNLLDAENSLYNWQLNPQDESLPAQLCDELDQLAMAADQAGAGPLSQLSVLLSQVYKKILQQQLVPVDDLLQPMAKAHDVLLGMIDCVAANQELLPITDDLRGELEALIADVVESAEPDLTNIDVLNTELPTVQPPVEPESESAGLDIAPSKPEVEPALLDPLPEVVVQPLNRDDIDLDILEIFIAEADELLEGIDQALQSWQGDWGSVESVDNLKRLLHTLKGGARMAGLEQLGTLSHAMENDILVLESNRSELNSDIFSRLLRQQDSLTAGLSVARQLFDSGEPVPVREPASVGSEMPTPPVSPDIGEIRVEASYKPDMIEAVIPQIERQTKPQEMVKVSAPLLESLVNLAGETSISRGRIEQQVSEFAFTLDEMESTIIRLKDQVRRLGMETDAQVMFRQEQIDAMSSSEVEGFDPLEMDRYSQLQQLSRGLLESASDLKDLKSTLVEKARGAEAQLLSQARINTDLQERLMRTRMVPFSRMVPRLRRMVRQLSDELGKKVELQLVNVDGEMDRSMMEQMLAPLEHMIRNSIDHGIESSEDRIQLGKPEVGVISVGFVREGGDILLMLADDGRGLNIDAIRQRALERGLMTPEAALGDQDVIQFIFHSGFSTSQQVTQVSGRGVGMDVVNSQVRELGGSVQIATKKGEGAQFTVRLPFTMSVNRALMIELGDDLFALPLSSVDGVVRLSSSELEHYYRFPDARLEYAGGQYEVRYLGSLLSDDLAPKIDSSAESALMVLVHSESRMYAVQVDGLTGSSEIVVKSLGPQFSNVPGLSGATLLGDGRVVVILDLLALLRGQTDSRAGIDVHNEQEPPAQSAVPTVMVVDDSVTVRKVAGRFLERQGFNVITARDGVEAMELLQDQRPDVMLLDIEMPRMDGFEVARRVKGNEDLNHIPIIMITSRTGEKHRERAMALGVEQYLGKPYQEDVLLASITELIGMAVEQ